MRNTESMGEKINAYKQKEMSGVADKIRAKVDSGKSWNLDLWPRSS